MSGSIAERRPMPIERRSPARPRLVTVMSPPLCFAAGPARGRRGPWVYSTSSTACRTARAARAIPARNPSGGMSPMTMAILGLLAWKASSISAAASPSAPRRRRPRHPATWRQPARRRRGGGLGDLLKGGLGGLLAGGAAGSVLSGGLGDLLKQFQQSGQGEAANSWVGKGPNKAIAPDDLGQCARRRPDRMPLLAERPVARRIAVGPQPVSCPR